MALFETPSGATKSGETVDTSDLGAVQLSTSDAQAISYLAGIFSELTKIRLILEYMSDVDMSED